MKTVCFINGSPKIGDSMSHFIIENMEKMIGDAESIEIKCTDVLKEKDNQETFSKVIKADDVVFAFPLYIDSIPSSMLEVLYKLNDYIDEMKTKGNKMPRCYAVVNEGFYGGTQNVNAIDNIMHFCKSAGFNFRFGVGIGAGEYLRSTKKIPLNNKSRAKVYYAIKEITDDIINDGVSIHKNIFADPEMTKRLFVMAGDMTWIKWAKKNGVGISNLRARPFVSD